MSSPPERSAPSPLARALGRFPSGLFILTTETPDGPIGFLASFCQQVGFDPPTVAVAVAKERGPLEAIRSCGSFALSVLDPESKGCMAPFFGKVPEGKTPFDLLEHSRPDGPCAVLDDALAWVQAEVSGEHVLEDHVILFGKVVAGDLRREGDPLVHLRKNGLSY